jgi:hypothetical protein
VRTYDMDCFIDCGEATSPNLFHLGEAPNSVRLPRASRSRGLHVEREKAQARQKGGSKSTGFDNISAIDVVADKS